MASSLLQGEDVKNDLQEEARTEDGSLLLSEIHKKLHDWKDLALVADMDDPEA